MNDESKSHACPRCGAALSANQAGGLCPRCLLIAGVNSTCSRIDMGPTRSEATPSTTDAEVTALFPELELHGVVGRGGMGVVYKARQPSLDRFVALKLLTAPGSNAKAFAERFTREARALARLTHPHIVTVHEFGERHGRFFLLMEFVDGLNLRQLLDQRNVSPAVALQIVPKICEALQFAHDAGIVHRDIKPENILIDRHGRVKIADFGIAKLVDPASNDFALTGAADRVGTPHYMAPEQVEHARSVDHRADIYSLGVVFYELLTGELPLGRFAAPSRKVQIDVRLDEVVLRALEKEPEARFQRASDVRTEVETIAASPALPGSQHRSARRHWGWAAATIALLFAGSLAFFVLPPSKRHDANTADRFQEARKLTEYPQRLDIGKADEACVAWLRALHNEQPEELSRLADSPQYPRASKAWFSDQQRRDPEGWSKYKLALAKATILETDLPSAGTAQVLVQLGLEAGDARDAYCTIAMKQGKEGWRFVREQRWPTLAAARAQLQTAKSDGMPRPTLEGQPAVVVRSYPVSGATDIAPGEIEIAVTFSKAMQEGSFTWAVEWAGSVPEIGERPAFTADHRTCVLKATLAPGRTYAFRLNGSNQNFKDENGNPALPYLLTFSTRDQPQEPPKPGTSG